MANKQTQKQDKLYTVSFFAGQKIVHLDLWANGATYTNNLYCLVDCEGEIVFEAPKESFVSLVKKEATDEQRKTSKPLMLASRQDDNPT